MGDAQYNLRPVKIDDDWRSSAKRSARIDRSVHPVKAKVREANVRPEPNS